MGATPGRRPCRTSRKRRPRARCGSMPRDNIIVAIDAVDPGRGRAGHHGHGAHPARAQDGGAGRSPRASRSSSSGRSSALPPRTSRPAPTSTPTTARYAEFERDYAFAQDAREEALLPPEAPRHLPRLPPRQRQGRHAQLHRHPHQRELLGLGRPLHGRGRQPLRHPRRNIPTSTASSRSCTARAAALPARARATTRWSARNGATPAIPISPPRWSSASAARCSRSRA